MRREWEQNGQEQISWRGKPGYCIYKEVELESGLLAYTKFILAMHIDHYSTCVSGVQASYKARWSNFWAASWLAYTKFIV